MVAAGRNDEALVELLLEAGANAGKRDAEGVSALTIAKADGYSDIITRLRSAGARESQEELLDEAVRAGDLDAVARLLDEGADANALDTNDYQTPLMTALELRELEILLRLVQAGADPTREGTGIQTSGENAISVAARQSSPWALRVLVDARARQTDLDRALMIGCANVAIVRVALEAGANVNARGRTDETPLICAASAGSAEAVSALLEAGANLDATARDGRTASDVAKLEGFDGIVTLLTR
jgi:ankyrin repeat protein